MKNSGTGHGLDVARFWVIDCSPRSTDTPSGLEAGYEK